MCQSEATFRGSIVQVMENADCHHQIGLASDVHPCGFFDLENPKLATTRIPPVRCRDIVGIDVEAEVTRGRKIVENLGRAASDIDDYIVSLGPQMLGDKGPPHPVCPGNGLPTGVQRRVL
ncbi:MAG: hypothetical protein QOF19_1123 [Alphaproteobacteria bacterium]|nr:hypothetical protein [Alphaproteobacteria bacterium]